MKWNLSSYKWTEPEQTNDIQPNKARKAPTIAMMRTETNNLLIHGYLHDLKCISSPPENVCILIKHYYTIYDIWGIIDDGLRIEYGTKIKRKSLDSCTKCWFNAFSYQSFWRGIVEFKLKMNGLYFVAGVVPTANIVVNTKCAMSNIALKDSIGWWSQCGIIRNDTNGDIVKTDVVYGRGCEISIVLDFKQYRAIFKKNGVLQGSLAIKQNISYNVGISACSLFGVEYIS